MNQENVLKWNPLYYIKQNKTKQNPHTRTKERKKKTPLPSSRAAIVPMAAPMPSSTPPPAAANPSHNPRRKRKPRPKTALPSALNPNWAQLQSKLPHRPAATHLGKRKHDDDPPAPAEPSPPPAVQDIKLDPTSDDTR